MNCPYCGTPLNENHFCPKCGKKVYAPGSKEDMELILPKKKKKKSGFFGIFILMIIFIAVALYAMHELNNETLNTDKKIKNNTPHKIILNELGSPKYISSNTNTLVRKNDDIYKVLEEFQELYEFTDPEEEFEINTSKSEKITYYKLEQKFNNIPVRDHMLVISVDQNGKVISITGNYIKNIDKSVLGELTEKDAVKLIPEDETIIKKERVIQVADNIEEVYLITTQKEDELKRYIISAKTEEVLYIENDLKDTITYKYTPKEGTTINIEEFSNVSGTSNYKFSDETRKIYILDNKDFKTKLDSNDIIAGRIENNTFIYNENTEEDKELVDSAVNTMKNYEEIYDYYKNILNRKGPDDRNGEIVINLNKDIEETGYYTLNGQIYLNPEITSSKDILAHEYTHAVISNISSLGENIDVINTNKTNESGALKEGYANILASLIEGKNWIIGESSLDNSLDLSKPSLSSLPSKKDDIYYFPVLNNKELEDFLEENNVETLYQLDKGGIHTNMSVVSYAAYLMFKNNAFANNEEMARIWYNSLFMLTPLSDFEDCALAVISTARNLGITEENIKIIEDAFYETNMLKGNSLTLKGTVIKDEETISNAKVTIMSNSNNEIKFVTGTNKEGEFKFEGLTRGKYLLSVEKDGYLEKTQIIDITDTQEIKVDIEKQTNGLSYNTEPEQTCTSKYSNCNKVTLYNKENNITKEYYVKTNTLINSQLSNLLNNLNIKLIYKDTDIPFDLNTKITSDIELEIINL